MRLPLLLIFFHFCMIGRAEIFSGDCTMTVKVRNENGSPAVGKRFVLSTYGKGVPDSSNFKTILEGIVSAEGTIKLTQLLWTNHYQIRVEQENGLSIKTRLGFLRFSFSKPGENSEETLQLVKGLSIGAKAPNFRAHKILEERKMSLSDYKGKVVVLKFWATWCPSCQPEMAALNELALKRKKEWEGKVSIVALSIDDEQEVTRSRVQKNNWLNIEHLFDSRGKGFDTASALAYSVISLPTTYIIHPSGIVIWYEPEDQLEDIIDLCLKELGTEEGLKKFLGDLKDNEKKAVK